MKVLQINAVSGKGSTGKICESISRLLDSYKVENEILYAFGTTSYSDSVKYADDRYIKFQALKSRIFGNNGFNSRTATKKLTEEIDRFDPSIVHLHNLHGHSCDLNSLFEYLKKTNRKLIWTFHDCWAFTGYCTCFTLAGCEKWKNGCRRCPQKKGNTWFFDYSDRLYRQKKELFDGLDLTIVTPSEWLAGLVKQSFLKEYPVKVINNGIDLGVFQPTKNDFRRKYRISDDRHILLGVAFDWGVRKGLDVFAELQGRLDKEKYQIVLVGTDDDTDRQLPKEIISIHRTQNQKELAEIYTAADLFVNPTREENYPTVNMEAIACGTPVITFKTGGSPEILTPKTGMAVDCDDIDAMQRGIEEICQKKMFSREDCIERARAFDANERFLEYIDLYHEIV